MKALPAGGIDGANMMTGTDGFYLTQRDGGPPTTLAAGSAPGESGVSILNVRFQGATHIGGTPGQHLVGFMMLPEVHSFECRLAGRVLRHEVLPGARGIAPAGADCVVDTPTGGDALFVAIDPGVFALAAAEDSALEAQLIESFAFYDQELLDLGRMLLLESLDDYPNGPLFWSEIASRFIDNLIVGHTSALESQTRGTLGRDVLARLRDYVMAHLDEPLEVATLARMAGRSPFHFSRVFTRSVGMTPHRYIVHLRLQHAMQLVREGRSGFAEIAARTGFADQSHLSRWVRRVHGVSLTQVPA
jgi:AraC family transcriptional regulator